MRGAIARRTGALLEELRKRGGVDVDAALPRVFHALVYVDAAGKAARQRTSRNELMAAPAPVPWLVEALIKERLLLAEDVGGRAVVTLAHEALLQEWPTLNEWLGHNRDRLRIGWLLSTISTMRGVLLLGRFTPERKKVLEP